VVLLRCQADNTCMCCHPWCRMIHLKREKKTWQKSDSALAVVDSASSRSSTLHLSSAVLPGCESIPAAVAAGKHAKTEQANNLLHHEKPQWQTDGPLQPNRSPTSGEGKLSMRTMALANRSCGEWRPLLSLP